MKELSAEVLRMQFSYDPSTGHFIRRGQAKQSGRIATKGYRQIALQGTRYMAHRLAWLYVYGEFPKQQIDHINQNKDDNRIANLREVTVKQNAENVTVWGQSSSGRRGVYWIERLGKWQADIKHNGKTIHLGTYESLIEAVSARIRGEQKYFTHTPHSALVTHSHLFTRDFDAGLGHTNIKTR